jgi:beta-galactosidase
MVRIARRVQAARRGPIDPGYASPTSNNQAATARPNTPLDPTTRFGQPLLLDWTPKDQSPHTENVEIYTNAQEVELFLNDKSLGTQRLHPDASPITFQVPFESGTLKAVARSNGKVIAEDELRTAGKPARLLLSTGLSAAHLTKPSQTETTPALTPDWNDIAYITATLVDANNTVIPDSTTIIHFATNGPGTIIAVDNGNLLDHDSFQATTPEKDRKLYESHAIAILRATASSGNITLTATTEGLPPATMTLHATQSHPSAIERSF